MVGLFGAGYLLIALEHQTGLNKAASALLTGVLCWAVYGLGTVGGHGASEELMLHLGDIASILFFLLGAMTIVGTIDLYNGFSFLTNKINATSKVKLLWILSFLGFFLSAILDNLTTTIVMISLIRKMLDDEKDKLYFSAFMVIVANAGGAFSPLGDVTTTMLWIGGQISAVEIIKDSLLASLAVMLVPLVLLTLRYRGQRFSPAKPRQDEAVPASALTVFIFGVLSLLFVPVFKQLTNLPPMMGMMLALGFMWVLTTFINRKKEESLRKELAVSRALEISDTPTILFFLGILLAVSALEAQGILADLAGWIDHNIPGIPVIGIALGSLSAIIDNVPLVAATQGMYSLATYPTDHVFWQITALASGTGGSMIIIGSAPGVVAMGMQKIDFFWYLKNISWLALVGFLSGNAVYWLQQSLTG